MAAWKSEKQMGGQHIKKSCQKASFGIGGVEPVSSSATLLITTKLLLSILNYLLAPWSRVLLEKLTSKLCS